MLFVFLLYLGEVVDISFIVIRKELNIWFCLQVFHCFFFFGDCLPRLCASQVVMVAVPTVLGIASIRVYTVSEAPADGLVSREKVSLSFNISPTSALWSLSIKSNVALTCLCGQLNVYTPVAQSAHDELVPEQPGVIQKGLTTARETIQPYVRATQVFVLFRVCLNLLWS